MLHLLLEEMIARLQALEEFRKVGGAASVKSWLVNTDTYPAVGVVTPVMNSKPNRSSSGVLQTQDVIFAVVIVRENNSDDEGARSSIEMTRLAERVTNTLIGAKANGMQQCLEHQKGADISFVRDIHARQDNFLLPNYVISGA